MICAFDVVHALRGKWFARDRYGIARCPVHDDRNPSLSIKDGDKTLLVKCHAGCDPRDILDALRQRGTLDRQPTRPAQRLGMTFHAGVKVCPVNSGPDRTAYALNIWHEAIDARGSPAWTYLFRRGVGLGALPPDTSHVLRWHRHCPWESGRHGCMLALFTDAVTGEPRAIHRTAITAAGEKVDRKALGPVKGCVIRLWPDQCVTQGLVIAEGIETALVAATRIAHRGTLLQPAWACGFAGNLKAFPVLAGVDALTILVDHDASGTGQDAAAECARRWITAGREVTRLTPRRPESDFADMEIAS